MNGLLFTYALTYGGAIVSLFNPFYGLLIYFCFAIVKPPALWPWCVPVGNYSRVIGVAFLAGWALNGFGDRSLGKAKPIVLCLLGYFVAVVFSTFYSPDPSLGMPFVEYLAKIILPFVAAVTLIHTRQQLNLLLYVILGSCAFLAYEANLTYLHGYNFESGEFISLDNNSFSILMVSSFGLAPVLGLEEEVLWRRFVWFGVAAAMAHVSMFAYSRGGMMGVLAAAIVAAIVTPKSRRTWFMLIGAVVVGSVLAGPSVVAEFDTSFKESSERDFSAQSRLDLWRDCTQTMFEHPIFGIGQEHWGKFAPKYGWPVGKEAHSLWFQTAAELGIPGVSFLVAFYTLTIWGTWKASRTLDVEWMPKLARMMLVGLTGFAVSASFVTVEGFELPYYIALIGACGVKVAYAEAAEKSAYAWDESDWPALPLPHRGAYT